MPASCWNYQKWVISVLFWLPFLSIHKLLIWQVKKKKRKSSQFFFNHVFLDNKIANLSCQNIDLSLWDSIKLFSLGMKKQMQPLSLLLFMEWFLHKKDAHCCPVSLLVPQKGKLLIYTEFGKMLVQPKEICVIQVNDVSPSPCLSNLGAIRCCSRCYFQL